MNNNATIHIFNSENSYQIEFIRFLEKHFTLSKHIFVFRTHRINKSNYQPDSSIVSAPNFLSLILLSSKLAKADKVFLHYLPYGPSLPFWAIYSLLFRNLVWVFWGGDIYVYREFKRSIKTRYYEFFRRIIIKRIRNVSGLLEEDFNLIKEFYKTKAKYTKAIYPLPTDFKRLEAVKKVSSTSISDKKIRILAGNSSDPTNNHFELFQLLGKYSSEDIEVICPLSYGRNKEYISEIAMEGRRIFGEKFIPLLDFQSLDEYSKTLNSIDIAVMNHSRQQGLGNIISLLWLGKKIYLQGETTSFSYFKSEGVAVFKTGDIRNESFNSFILMSNDDAIKNKSIVLNTFSEENYRKLWNNVFNLK